MAEASPHVILDTSMGEIEIELNAEKAPITVKNFLDYVKAGHYDGLIFHRVIPNFMVQGGGFTPDMKEKRGGSPIKNEAGNGLRNDRGTLAMARTQVVDSATAQFFINVKDNYFLNHSDETARGFGYAVFGKVVRGMEAAMSIVDVPTRTVGGHENVPITPVTIRSARIVEPGA